MIDNILFTTGYRQSYSGSEASTDISLSSTENLSTSARQDPQGEETVQVAPSPGLLDPGGDGGTGDATYSELLAHLAAAMPASAVEVKSANSTFYVTGSRPMSTSPSQELQVSLCCIIGMIFSI